MNSLSLNINKEKIALLLDQGIVSGSNFVISVLLAKKIGIDQYAIFATVQLLQLFLASFHQALITLPLLSLVSGNPKKEIEHSIVSTIVLFHFGIIILLFFLVLISSNLSGYFPVLNQFPLLESALFVIMFLHLEFVRKYLQIFGAYKVLIAGNVIAYILPILIILMSVNLNLVFVFFVFISCQLVVSFLTLYDILKRVKRGGLTKKAINQVLSFSKWLIGKTIVQWLSGNYYLIIGGVIIGKQAIAAIRIIQNLFGVFNVLFLVLENYLAIKSTLILKENGLQPMIKFNRTVLAKSLIYLMLLFVLVAFFSETIVHFLYGETYIDYAYLIYGFVLLYLLIMLNMPNRFILRSLAKTHVIFYSYTISAAVSLLLAQVLVNKFGVLGIVYGLIISQLIILIWNHFSFVFIKKSYVPLSKTKF